MTHTAFHKEDELGDPVAQDQLGAVQETPVTSESEAPRLVEEKAEKDFNRRKMGGFLMELGLNILSSNRDDAGAAVGDAFGKTRSDRTERKRVRAAEDLARSERERKQRREDESDTLKQEKADREVAAAKRAESKEGREQLEKIELDDGGVGFYKIEEGRVYKDKEGKVPLKIASKDWDRLSANNVETSIRALHRDLAAEEKSIRDSDLFYDNEMTDAEVKALTKKNVKARLKTAKRLYSEQDVDDVNEEEFADDDPLGLL